jgi:hypothetical protein
MAELIPLEYRIRVARARLISRWFLVLIVTAGAAAAALVSTYVWRRQAAQQYARAVQEYQDKADILKQYGDLRAKRDDLAARMRRLQDLRTDKVLVSLLNNVSSCFSEADCLDYVSIEAHPADGKSGDSRTVESRYSVRVRGITVDDTSHSHLLERLTVTGRKSDPPIQVPLGEKHLLQMLDGVVTSFDITCSQPLAKGG